MNVIEVRTWKFIGTKPVPQFTVTFRITDVHTVIRDLSLTQAWHIIVLRDGGPTDIPSPSDSNHVFHFSSTAFLVQNADGKTVIQAMKDSA